MFIVYKQILGLGESRFLLLELVEYSGTGRSAPTSGTIRPKFWVVPPQHP